MNKDRLVGVGLVGLGALAAAVIVGNRAMAQPNAQGSDSNRRTLHVSGTAVIYAKPDTATVQVGVSKSAETVASAKAQCDATVSKVDNALRLSGVKPEDIQTVGYSVSPETRMVNKKPHRYWSVSETYSVKIRDVQSVSKVLDGALASGATTVDQIQFSIENIAEFRSKARANAVTVARAKAEGLAKEMGVTLGEVVTVTDQADQFNGMYQSAGNVNFSLDYPNDSSNRASVRGGQLSTTDRVDVDYEIH